MYKPLASIVLPSLRPHQLAQCLASIHRYTADIDYEAVVVSPFDIAAHPKTVHVKESKTEGIYRAVANGCKRAKGEYIIHIPDDTRATPLWATNMISFMRPHDDEIFEGNFRFFDAKGERAEPGIYRYGKLIAPFLCIRRDKAAHIGGLMDCYYKSFRGDADLSLRVWWNGGEVKTCPNAWIYYPECDDEIYKRSYNKYYIWDQEAFIRRWDPIYSQPGKSFESTRPITEQNISLELPPEGCAKIYVSIQKRDWKTVRNVLCSKDSNACIYPESYPVLHDFVVTKLRSPINPRKTLYSVLQWLRERGYKPSPADAEFKENQFPHDGILSRSVDFAFRVATITRTRKLILRIITVIR